VRVMTEAAYRDLGLTPADGERLFDSAAAINAELDRYLAPQKAFNACSAPLSSAA
jgi:hypothetical protein